MIRRPGLVILSALLVLAFLACGDDGGGEPGPSPTATASSSPVRSPSPSLTPRPTASPPQATVTPSPQNSTDAPTAPPTQPPDPAPEVGLQTPVSKQHSIPASYVPPDLTALPSHRVAPGFGGQQLRAEAATALETMLAAAGEAGHDIRVRSSYRSYSEQADTFQYWVDQLGLEEAERVSARAGHSEHQLGTAADLTSGSVGWELTEAFGDAAEGQWLAANGHRFGFALSYPESKESVTGYRYEPWHWRYIGADAAAAWQASGLTLIEYLVSL